jgi:hypothetical protein
MSDDDAWSSLNRADQLPAEVKPRPRKAVPPSKAVLESSVSRSEHRSSSAHTPDDLDPTTEPSSKPIKDPKEDPEGNPPKTHTPAAQDPSSSNDKPDPPPADPPPADPPPADKPEAE